MNKVDDMKNFFKEIYYSIIYYFKTTDKLLFFMSVGASLLSLPLIYSLFPNAISTLRPFYIQIIAFFVGVISAIIISNMDYHKIEKYFKHVAISAIVLNLLPFTPIGKDRGDDMLTNAGSGSVNLNWINIGFTKIQPSDFLKIAFILTFSYHCSKVLKNINKPKVLIKLVIHSLVPVAIIYMQKDYGTMSVFFFIIICIMLVANTNWKVILAMGGVGAIVLILFLTKNLPSYLLERFYVLYNLEEEKLGIGNQQYSGRTALGTGGIFGKGFFSKDILYSTQELHNDMIFAHIGQIFGFIGCVLVLIWIFVYCMRILQIGKDAKDNLGCLICVGVFAVFFFQSAINIGMVLVICPVIGIALPFFSAGGTCSVSTYMLLGILLSIKKHSYRLTLFNT